MSEQVIEEQVTKKLDEVAQHVSDFQKSLEDNKGEMSTKLDVLQGEIAGGIETVNTLNEQVKNQEDQVKEILTQISRVPAGQEEGENQEMRIEFSKYLRYGVPLTETAKQELCDHIAKSTYKDADSGWVKNKAQEMKSLMVGNDPNGGFWVRPEFSSRTLFRTFESSAMRQISTVETIGTEAIEYVIDDNEFQSGGWVSEIQSRPDTDNAEIGTLSIHTHEQYAQPKATEKMLSDVSFDLEAWISRKVADKLGRDENTAFVVGDGAGKPKGILSYDAWAVNGTYERGKVEQIDSGIAGGFNADSFIATQNATKELYQGRATWLMKRATFGDVLPLKNGIGGYLINPLLIAQGADKVLLGQPVMFADDMPVVANDSLSVAYGDFSEGYTIVDRTGIRMLRDPFTNKPFIRFYTTKRVGGAVTNYESFKIMKLAV